MPIRTHVLLRVNERTGDVSESRPGAAPGPTSNGYIVSVEGVPDGLSCQLDIIPVFESKVGDLNVERMEYRVGWADLIP